MNENPNRSKRARVNNLCPELDYAEAEVEDLIATLDRECGFDAPAGELSIAFVPLDEISRLHEDYMNDPTPTDVITFPGEPDLELAGEICACPQIALEYANGKDLDFATELTLYLIHGYLHLCGFDDQTEETRSEMREAEQSAMKTARLRNRVPRFAFNSVA